MLDRSHVFRELVAGHAPLANYSINGHDYTMRYYLAENISPRGNKQQNFAKDQASTRKDIERAFGALQTRFTIVHGTSRFWDTTTLTSPMNACVVLHSMIVEDQSGINGDIEYDEIETVSSIEISRDLMKHFFGMKNLKK